jgi:hypothetical protein
LPTPTQTPIPARDSNAGLEINYGAEYTNRLVVTLRIRPPTESILIAALRMPAQAEVIQMEVSNHPHFSPAVLLPFSPVTTWTLDREETDGLRTVYIRFMNGYGRISGSYEDSIILDDRPPVGSISIGPQGEGTMLLHLPASDDLSGVQQMRLSFSEELQEGNWIGYEPTYELPAREAATLYVRYRDGAGNTSDAYRGVNLEHLALRTYLPLSLSRHSR